MSLRHTSSYLLGSVYEVDHLSSFGRDTLPLKRDQEHKGIPFFAREMLSLDREFLDSAGGRILDPREDLLYLV